MATTELDIVTRLEGSAPDRELDCMIHELLNPSITPDMRGKYYGEFTGEYFDNSEGFTRTFHAPEYSLRIDDALRFASAVGAVDYALQHMRGKAWARLTAFQNGFSPSGEGRAQYPASAICAAAFRLKSCIAKVQARHG